MLPIVHVFARLAIAVGLLGLAGCPARQDGGDRPSGTSTCTHFGQTCEVSPNKLGSCVVRDNCAVDCLVCQSQH
jgi:hypothetical protein